MVETMDLIILNYQREIPPFMQNIIHYADEQYNNIFYLTPELYNNNCDGCNSNKLELIQIPRINLWKQLVRIPKCLFDRTTAEQVRIAFGNHLSIMRIIKHLIGYNILGDFFASEIERMIINGVIKEETTVILATWFSVEALAGAKIKKKHPQIRFVSLAHSFEVNINNNPLILYGFNRVKHEYCDHIYFISDEIRKQYFSNLYQAYKIKKMSNTSISYLGSRKYYPNRTVPSSSDNVFRILSCSGVVPVKRVHLIVDALKEWNGGALEWTHIGDGPLLSNTIEYAKEKLLANKAVTFRFLGHFENIEVHQYYNRNSIDIFVNVSNAEGLPVSIMECMSYGVPAIATDVGGCREIVTNETGFLIRRDFIPNELTKILYNFSNLTIVERLAYRISAQKMWSTKFNGTDNARHFLQAIKCEEDINSASI